MPPTSTEQAVRETPNPCEIRLAIIQTHVVEYFGPFFRQLARQPGLSLTVYYGSKRGVEKSFDKDFGVYYQWNHDLLNGYNHTFLVNKWQLFGVIRRRRYDAVLVYGWAKPLYWIAFLVALASRTPFILTGDTIAGPHECRLRRIIRDLALTVLLRKAGAILSMSKLNEALYESFSIDRSKVFLCPYSPDVEYFAARSLDEKGRLEGRARAGIPESATVFLFVGKLIPRKRPFDMVDAYRMATKRAEGIRIVFCGDGALRPSLDRAVTAEPSNHVLFIGFRGQSDMPEIYSLADVLVLPSENEPWGVVVNEAMACGRPVIVSDSVGAANDDRFLKHGDNALIYKTGDVAGLAACMIALCNSGVRNRMGQAASATVDKWNYRLCIDGVSAALTYITKSGHIEGNER